MKLIKQEDKIRMEYCKKIAKDNGLSLDDTTLEYVVTNMDMLELSPKVGIPTLYDFWVDEAQVFRGKKEYELYPHNPYETVVNTRPALSYYNINNPDWLNKMIYYHVLGHIDFFQNNRFFSHTWHEDFTAKALFEKKRISTLRRKNGRFADYVIEAARSIDNIVNYFPILDRESYRTKKKKNKVDFFFDVFIQKKFPDDLIKFRKYLSIYNLAKKKHNEVADDYFINEVVKEFDNFITEFKSFKVEKSNIDDLLLYISEHSEKIEKKENRWFREILSIVRDTSLYFSPQIRTKIMNEGWASYWHEKLFLEDPELKGHGCDFAKINAGVLSLQKVRLNPYAIGFRLFHHIKDKANKGHYTREFENLKRQHDRKVYNKNLSIGEQFIFDVRNEYSDFTFINNFVDQDFVDRYQLYVMGQRFNQDKGKVEFFIKSRNAIDYKEMLLDSLYQMPNITIDEVATQKDGMLHLVHKLEGKELVQKYIQNVMFYLDYLWGKGVVLHTSEYVVDKEGKIVGTIEFEYTQKNDGFSVVKK